MKLTNAWLEILQNSSLDPCPRAAEEIMQLRSIVEALLVNDEHEAMTQAERYAAEPETDY